MFTLEELFAQHEQLISALPGSKFGESGDSRHAHPTRKRDAALDCMESGLIHSRRAASRAEMLIEREPDTRSFCEPQNPRTPEPRNLVTS